MEIIKFIGFFIVTYFILMQIFNYSTYHKYFWKVFPLLVLYSALAGYLLFYFGLHGGFLWQIFLSIGFFISNSKKQNRRSAKVLNILDDSANIEQLNILK